MLNSLSLNSSCVQAYPGLAKLSAQPAPPASKIFFIGLHKTGTTTYARLCKAAGLKTYHGTGWLNSTTEQAKYDCFSDIQDAFHYSMFDQIQTLSTQWPQARFVLNTRPLFSWVVSVLDHTTAENKRCVHSQYYGKSKTRQEREQLGTPAFILTIVWRRALHHQLIRSYFGSSKQLALRLMIADVTTQTPEEISFALAAFFGLPNKTAALRHELTLSEPGKGHISSYHSDKASFIETTLHTGNEAEANAVLLKNITTEASHTLLNSIGVLGCPDKLLAV
eukprot:CAMPEP_0119345976 /NCGR_PEP_ID=MMETSP1333-20130426/107766_1 /TAXON_ID=418940 /ORGANISM="Scyphosphaera apsteinii, Strain RCC1455" /LENGTH=278 /DNA_ID=CAMNT_0007358465 /DNA_START=616 /DNA_END=1452 /DNA_ORIENTATION=+